MAGGMENAGTGVRHMGHDSGQFQTVYNLDGTFTASLDAEGYYEMCIRDSMRTGP